MTDFDEFSALARSWAQFYQTIETTYVSVRQGDTWYLLYSREMFYTEEPLDVPPVHIDTPSIRAGRFRTKIEEGDASGIIGAFSCEFLGGGGRAAEGRQKQGPLGRLFCCLLPTSTEVERPIDGRRGERQRDRRPDTQVASSTPGYPVQVSGYVATLDFINTTGQIAISQSVQ
jgi:hypothetical protein